MLSGSADRRTGLFPASIEFNGQALVGTGATTNARYASAGTDYFRTLGVPLIAGREFTRADVNTTAAVAIVKEAFAEGLGLGLSRETC